MSALLEKEKKTAYSHSGEDDVGQYLSEIHRYPRLSAQEELELAQRCADGDQEAVRQMVNSNLRLVVSIAREYAGRGVPLLDLIQEGSIGLLVAARKFDHTLQYRFSTYATKWIRQGITRCLMNHAGLIRVPAHTAERMRKLQAAAAVLQQESGQEPTPEELAQRTDMPVAKVQQLLDLIPQVCSLDTPVGSEEEATLGMLLEDIHAPQPQEELVRRELKAAMDAMLGSLNDRQQQILRLRFGMEDGICHSQQSIGTQLGISKERVRQIENQAMSKLQKLSEGLGLEDFLE